MRLLNITSFDVIKIDVEGGLGREAQPFQVTGVAVAQWYSVQQRRIIALTVQHAHEDTTYTLTEAKGLHLRRSGGQGVCPRGGRELAG